MPNTLAHIGTQLPITRAVFRKIDPRWIALGLMIPDLPWILQQLAHLITPNLPVIELRAYVVTMSTPLFCLLLSAAISVCFRKSGLIFSILAFESLLHEFLDCFQQKGGVGISFFAPFDWTSYSWPIFQMDGWISTLFTVSGIFVLIWLLLGKNQFPGPIQFESNAKKIRLSISFCLAGLYLIVPWFLIETAIRGNVHDLALWRGDLPKKGSQVHFDRAHYHPGSEIGTGWITHALSKEPIQAIGVETDQPSLISTIATFSNDNSLLVTEHVIHPKGRRFWYTIMGLVGVLLIWTIPVVKKTSIR